MGRRVAAVLKVGGRVAFERFERFVSTGVERFENRARGISFAVTHNARSDGEKCTLPTMDADLVVGLGVLNCHNLWFALVQAVQLYWLGFFVPPARDTRATGVHRAWEPGCALHAVAYPGLNVSAAHSKSTCYHRVVRATVSSAPPLLNRKHAHDTCPLPIVAAFRARLVETYLLRDLAVPRRVCWVARAETVPKEYASMYSWHAARIVRRQTALWQRVGALSDTEAHVLDFYNTSALPSMRAQLTEAARCALLVGMHGAGLNLAIAMEHPRVLELSRSHIANRNLQNLMTAVGGEYHGHIGRVGAETIAAHVTRILGPRA